MIKKYFRRNFNILFFIGTTALGMIFAKYCGVKRFYFRIFDIGAFFSMVLAGIFQAPSLLLPHNACILVAKIDLVQPVRILLLASVVSGIQFITH